MFVVPGGNPRQPQTFPLYLLLKSAIFVWPLNQEPEKKELKLRFLVMESSLCPTSNPGQGTPHMSVPKQVCCLGVPQFQGTQKEDTGLFSQVLKRKSVHHIEILPLKSQGYWFTQLLQHPIQVPGSQFLRYPWYS